MKEAAPDCIDQAIAWHLRLMDASREEWESFVEWLETDEAHRDAYESVVLDDRLLPVPTTQPAPCPRNGRWIIGGGAVAAAALAAFLLIPDPARPDARYSIETAPGQTRTVNLDQGTRIDMNGGTRLVLRRGDARYASLEHGEATFHVRHDAARPFELASGRFTIRDLGTVFNVTRDGQMLDIDVAEGTVLFDPHRKALRLTGGMALTIRGEQGSPLVRDISADRVGGWRRGLLDFRDLPVAEVVRAVSRSTGAAIDVADALGDRRFTGTLHLVEGPDVTIPRLAALIGAESRKVGGRWMMMSRSYEKP